MEVEISEGVVITIENDKEYLLLKKIDGGYFAVNMEDDEPGNTYCILKQHEFNGDTYMKIEKEFDVI